MKKKRLTKKEKDERYFLITIMFSLVSVINFLLYYFKLNLIVGIFLFFVLSILELYIFNKIISNKVLKQDYLSFLISILSILLYYLIITTFSNRLFSIVEVGLYLISYLVFNGLFLLNNIFIKKKKILYTIFNVSILIINLISYIFILR